MLVTAYYIISPNNCLAKRLKSLGVDSDIVEILSKPIMWDYHKVGSTKEDIIKVKLLFLMNCISEYFSINDYEFIFESSTINVDAFDKWWTIERFFIEESFYEVEKRIHKDIVDLLEITGDEKVDFWIKKIR